MTEWLFKQIGVIHTPYLDRAPFQPVETDEGDFSVELYPEYHDGLYLLDRFRYIFLIYCLHRAKDISGSGMRVHPPWARGREVGLFASRSPRRPNPIGLSVVQIRKIFAGRIFTSGLDVFDGTPLLDIKPYVKDLDTKTDADYGWIAEMGDYEHLLMHIRGIPHDY